MRGIIFILMAASLVAQEASSPSVTGEWVMDPGGLFSSPETGRLKSLVARINRRTKAQVVVLTAARVEAGGTREYAVRRFREWKLGSAERNDGVLVFLSRQERAVEIITGTGLQGRLPSEAMGALIKQRMLPRLRNEQAGEAVIDGVKEIGALLAGFRRSEAPPKMELLGLLFVFGLVGVGASGMLIRQWKQPLRLPPSGRRREVHHYPDGNPAKSKFMQNRTGDFFLQQANSLLPSGYRNYSAPMLWGAVAGLSVAAGAGAGLVLAYLKPELELPFWLAAVVAGLTSAATAAGLYGPYHEKWKGIGGLVLKVGIPAGFVGASAANGTFLSDSALAGWAAPLYVGAVNAGVGAVLAKTIDYWSPARFVCNRCGSELAELPQSGIAAHLEEWERKAVERGSVRFRGWRCGGKCSGVYLAHVVGRDQNVCPKCDRSAVAITGKKGWLIYSCTACGFEKKEKAAQSSGGGGGGYSESSSYTPSSSSSSSEEYDPNRYSNSSYDPPSSGGSTDGDGGSGNW